MDPKRQQYRTDLAKDILLTLIKSGNVMMTWSPGRLSTVSAQVVDRALELADYFMARVYDKPEEEK